MKDIVRKNNCADNFLICSSATSTEEIGNDTHYGTKKILDKEGIPYTERQAVQLKKSDGEKYDFIIGMDSANIKNIHKIIGDDYSDKVYKLLRFTGSNRDVADPWYTRNFEATYKDILLGCKALYDKIKTER